MALNISKPVDSARSELSKYGILLLTDADLPSVCGIVGGEPIRGSWWGHPRGKEIFAVAESLSDDPDVMMVKLISGKATFVDRRLWPALLRIATSGEAWQTNGITSIAKAILKKVNDDGTVRSDELAGIVDSSAKEIAESVRQLENKLRVYSEQVHTQGGAHAKALESWARWSNRNGIESLNLTVQEAKRVFEDIVSEMNVRFSARAKLPWMTLERATKSKSSDP